MFLGIEIGGTKLQLGVGPGDGATFTEFVRLDVDTARGGAGIRDQIAAVGPELVRKHGVKRVGYGFGGPVFGAKGIVQTSHQVAGWDQFPLVEWTQQQLGVPTRLGNDCDVAALAEATYGAGRQARTVFYVTVGTGIGGGLVIDKKIHGTDRPAAAEIGHLRPGLDATTAHHTVESRAAGPAISARVQRRLQELAAAKQVTDLAQQLLNLVDGNVEQLTTKQIAIAAAQGNEFALESYREATTVLGWAIAQMTTLLAPDVVIIGGGVSLVGDDVFFNPLRESVDKYSFPPLRGQCPVVPAALGESVVVHGALALAAAE
ncbi:MAG TPA: ROK family protein [Planctomycetaceae bacterium]|nr:ROK family protein [Planctomycetaceae bacterium]